MCDLYPSIKPDVESQFIPLKITRQAYLHATHRVAYNPTE